ncbi:MAG: hypothetical protein A2744_00665 [Candidatus Buchananbacteria bacterium RIFCSPHIGHO2_01_FULL_44_11]|uniref:Uncharacterized protein n=1 Tax=Candidatus Buchananbacteria bacterium RIFCSPHIGHO2_01_FULL_44_11 TaxID=1797535 RepID=A0A1G1XZX6_9BACT|nr:MAG: hypothetical protein A2744_00665 [Candidatus Buchananbacteria bacterium RIFCSPHIGHO2_01_FULL_44_11]
MFPYHQAAVDLTVLHPYLYTHYRIDRQLKIGSAGYRFDLALVNIFWPQPALSRSGIYYLD